MNTSTNMKPGSLAFHMDRMQAFASLNILRAEYQTYREAMETAYSSDSWCYGVEEAETFADVEAEAWNETLRSHCSVSTIWEILWARKDEFMFNLISELYEDIFEINGMNFCESGALCLDSLCGLNISKATDGKYVLRTQCLWNAPGEEDAIYRGSFLQVLQKTADFIKATSKPSPFIICDSADEEWSKGKAEAA